MKNGARYGDIVTTKNRADHLSVLIAEAHGSEEFRLPESGARSRRSVPSFHLRCPFADEANPAVAALASGQTPIEEGLQVFDGSAFSALLSRLILELFNCGTDGVKRDRPDLNISYLAVELCVLPQKRPGHAQAPHHHRHIEYFRCSHHAMARTRYQPKPTHDLTCGVFFPATDGCL
jgi:hypothetical protein